MICFSHFSNSGGSLPIVSLATPIFLLLVVHRAARLQIPGLARRARRHALHERGRRGRRHRLLGQEVLPLPPGGGPGRDGQEGQILRDRNQGGQGK